MPSAVTQEFEHHLDVIKGWLPGNMGALDHTTKFAANATAARAGRVAHIDANGQFVLGGSGTQMPIYLRNGYYDADVRNDGVSPSSGTTHWIAAAPVGNATGLVATGGYELQSTEYDSTRNYAINDLLSATATGLLTNENNTQYTHWICGICSRHVQSHNQAAAVVGPVGPNANGVNTITFWSYFLPESP